MPDIADAPHTATGAERGRYKPADRIWLGGRGSCRAVFAQAARQEVPPNAGNARDRAEHQHDVDEQPEPRIFAGFIRREHHELNQHRKRDDKEQLAAQIAAPRLEHDRRRAGDREDR